MVDGAKPGVDGQFFIAIDVASFTDPLCFAVGSMRIREAHGSRRAAGVDRLYVPGEIEAEFERDYQRDGILLAGSTVDDIAREAEALGVRADALFH